MGIESGMRVSRLHLLVYSVMVVASASGPLSAQTALVLTASSNNAVPLTLSRSGATGLVRVPTALVTPDGGWQLDYFSRRAGADVHYLGNSQSYGFSFGFLPHVELGVTLGDDAQHRDLTGNFKVQLLAPHGLAPAIAIGQAEIDKLTHERPTSYLALTFAVAPTLRLTAGTLVHNKARVYGGVEATVLEHVVLTGEYDTHAFNAELGLLLLRNRLRVVAQYVEHGWACTAGINLSLGTERKPPAFVNLPGPGSIANRYVCVDAVRSELVKLNLENVSVEASPETQRSGTAAGGDAQLLSIRYENRSFPHSEMSALAHVLAVAGMYASPEIKNLSVTVLRDRVPVLCVTLPVAVYRQFMAGAITSRGFSRSIHFSRRAGSRPSPPDTYAPRTASSSAGRADLFVRPGVLTQLGSDNFNFGFGFSARPDVVVPLSPGLEAEVRGDIPAAGPLRPSAATVSRAMLNWSTRVGANGLLRAYAGRFPGEITAAMGEALLSPASGIFGLRSELSVTRAPAGTPHANPSGLVEASLFLPHYDLTGTLSAGRYLFGDRGVVVGLRRVFGNTEVAIQFRRTTIGKAAVLQLGIPLGPDHLTAQPGPLRIRPPDFFEYEQRDLVASVNDLFVAGQVGNELDVLRTATNILLDRGRLNGAWIKAHLGELRRVEGLVRAHTPEPL